MRNKKIIIFTNILASLMLVGFVPLFVLWLALGLKTFLCVWPPLLLVGLVLFLSTIGPLSQIVKDKSSISANCIKIKAKNGNVIINTVDKYFKFKKIQIVLSDIVGFELVNNQTVIDKSGIGQSFVGGMLFGGAGAIAGAMVGKKQKIKDNHKVFIKTKNIRHAGIVVELKVNNAYHLFETLKLLINN